MARVVLENLSKIFQTRKGESIHAVRHLNLLIRDKELMVIVGPSGCGKTTTLRLIAGLEDPTAGTVSINGTVMNGVAPQDRNIAMVFQRDALLPHLTAFENMALGLKLRKFSKAEIEERVKQAAELLGLPSHLERLPRALSGGERQRVALGRAIVRQPKLFLFDEPLSNLDAQMRVQLRAEIAKLHQRLGTTMIYVTHDQVEGMTLGDRMAVVKDGMLQQVARPKEIYDRPANLYVAGFIGSPPINFFTGTLSCKGYTLFFHESHGAKAPPFSAMALRVSDEATAPLTGYIGRNVVLALRPEYIHIEVTPDAASLDAVTAVVERIELTGAETDVYLKRDAHSFVARLRGLETFHANQKVSLHFDMSKAHFFDASTERLIV